MVYYLTCGKCGLYHYVQSIYVATSWTCTSCANVNTTSLPMKAGSLSAVGQASSVVATTAYAVAPGVGVIQGRYASSVLQPVAPPHIPSGVYFVNGVSDKSGANGVVVQGLPVPGNIAYDGIHPYGDNP